MDSAILEQIPIQHDIFSYLMMGGIVYGLMLSLQIALKFRSVPQAAHLLMFLLISLSMILVDLFLGHTGLMKYTLNLDDSTESLVLWTMVLIYLLLLSVLSREHIHWRKHGLHFLLPLGYFIYQWFYFLQPVEVKLYSYVTSFHPGLEIAYVPEPFDHDPLSIKKYWRWVLVGTGIFYVFASMRLLDRYKVLESLRKNYTSKLVFARNLLIGTLLVVSIAFATFYIYENDLGDVYVGTFIALCIMGLGFFVSGQSRIYDKSWLADKYETSGLKQKQEDIWEQIQKHFEHEQPYLQNNFSLSTLTQQLHISSNYLSQAINTQTGQNFNEFVNQYRIKEAQKRLTDPSYQHLNIEGIGLSVGFRSKSAFYTAFKKFADCTPREYMKAASFQ